MRNHKWAMWILAFSAIVISSLDPAQASEITFSWKLSSIGLPLTVGSQRVTITSDMDALTQSYGVCGNPDSLVKLESDCISKLEAKIGEGPWIDGTFLNYVNGFSNGALSASQTLGTFNALRSSVWKISDESFTKFPFYMVGAQMNAPIYSAKVDYGQSQAAFRITSIANPEKPSPGPILGDVRFRLHLKLSSSMDLVDSTSWVVARATDAKISQVTSADSLSQEMILEGGITSLLAPSFKLPIELSAISSYVERLVPQNPDPHYFVRQEDRPLVVESFIKRFMAYSQNTQYVIESESLGAVGDFAAQEKYFDKNLLQEVRTWEFTIKHGGAVSFQAIDAARNCARTKTVGALIESNATVVDPGPPTFNSKTGAIEYRVAGVHRDVYENISEGIYSLTIPKSLATCMWGSDATSARVEVSVVGDDGAVQVATALTKTDATNMYFSVRGFHYSANTIQVKLIQPKVAVAKKITITCVKGKVSKKVTAVNAKCPSGYKLKK